MMSLPAEILAFLQTFVALGGFFNPREAHSLAGEGGSKTERRRASLCGFLPV